MTNTFERIFKLAIDRVPAYKDFIIKNMGFIPHTPDQYALIPLMDKKNYINNYPLTQLCLDGRLHDKHIICRSSGNHQALYWPQLPAQEKYTDDYLLSDLNEFFNLDHNPVLAIIALGLGSYWEGELVSWGLRSLAMKNQNLTLFTPGMNEEEILEALEKFSPHYKYTVIYSHPPYAKRIIDQALRRKIPISGYNIYLRLSGEGYSENYRDYLNRHMGYHEDNIRTILSGYSGADFGSVAKETLFCAAIKRLLHKHPSISNKIFSSPVMPSICQYQPALNYLESIDEELVITKHQAIPLIRYRTSDKGDIIEFDDMISKIKREGIDPYMFAEEFTCPPETIPKLPFVIIHGRIDGRISIHNADIMVYQIKDILEKSTFLSEYFTGNFYITRSEDEDLNPLFEIYLELKDDELIPDTAITSQEIAINLQEINPDYKKAVDQEGLKAFPFVKLLTNGSFLDRHKIRYTE